ncbi:hypothetical protein HO173_012323 [Letharia columbiana]|uniref:RCC1-like domain-containing protein n=1 Tax=Letharia columbiana TaxID=112416 RepID=A0A8H6FGB6_9LECA|nr:uncharacterized protein HO173_012323 [Letharia columbiana]KAF6226819.1 hypothetical protein HO173_012323 [Letharia columbiana]
MAAPKKLSGTKKTATTASKTASKASFASQTAASENNNTRKSKRKAEELGSSSAVTKSRKFNSSKAASKSTTRAPKPKLILNHRATDTLNVYVFGSGDSGVLGLGPKCSTDDVVRPRLNPNLSASFVGVVQMATGGMHCVALRNDNKILTWGVNDHGALGRDTEWGGGWKDMDGGDHDQDSDNSESELNPKESSPTAIDSSCFPANTVFTQVAAGDNATFALTEEGLVYGWGTFKVKYSASPFPERVTNTYAQTSDGALHFSADMAVQNRPTLISGLRNITKIAAGSNHALALDHKGCVFAWGFGEQCQLGRRINARFQQSGLVPATFGLPKDVMDIGAGADHSFAIHRNGIVYGWGANNYCQTGIDERDGEDFANILRPQSIDGLTGHGKVTSISGGNHHSVAVTDGGACLTWGRVDTNALGLSVDSLAEHDIIRDAQKKPRILKSATQVPGINAVHAAAGSDHCVAVTHEGKAYSWGFGVSGQLGLGDTDDVGLATLIENKAVKDKKLVWAGAGGQYSVLAGKE